MTSWTLVRDDPEVRAQHRSQVRHRHLTVIRKCVITGLSFFVVFAGLLLAPRVIGDGVPALIVDVDRVRDVVVVTYNYDDETVTRTISVDDASAYAPGDTVRAFGATYDDVLVLDREPLASWFAPLSAPDRGSSARLRHTHAPGHRGWLPDRGGQGPVSTSEPRHALGTRRW